MTVQLLGRGYSTHEAAHAGNLQKEKAYLGAGGRHLETSLKQGWTVDEKPKSKLLVKASYVRSATYLQRLLRKVQHISKNNIY